MEAKFQIKLNQIFLGYIYWITSLALKFKISRPLIINQSEFPLTISYNPMYVMQTQILILNNICMQIDQNYFIT